jgi:hypothetical protein
VKLEDGYYKARLADDSSRRFSEYLPGPLPSARQSASKRLNSSPWDGDAEQKKSVLGCRSKGGEAESCFRGHPPICLDKRLNGTMKYGRNSKATQWHARKLTFWIPQKSNLFQPFFTVFSKFVPAMVKEERSVDSPPASERVKPSSGGSLIVPEHVPAMVIPATKKTDDKDVVKVLTEQVPIL